MRHDRLVLNLLQREVLDSLRSLRRRDFAWIILGGGVVIAYAAADAIVALHAAAPVIRNSPWLWLAGLPAAASIPGFFAGLGAVRLALSRAYAPFMKALPVSDRERRRMAVFTAACVGIGLAVLVAGFTVIACVSIAKPYAFAWAFAAAALFAAGFVAAMTAPLRIPSLQPAGETTMANHESSGARKRLTLTRFDCARPTWVGAWAWNLRAGAVTPSWRLFGAGIAMGLAVLISAAGGLVHHQAAPGAIAGLAGGLAVFMLALRYHPLGSPVLRTAPIGFGRAWLRLLWLPLQLSAAFFLLPAGAALAAEPSSWSVLAASFSFLAAIAYAAYESSEYGRMVVLGYLALVVWLFYRTRRRFYHG